MLLAAACGGLTKFKVAVNSDPPGMRVEANNEFIGVTPTEWTVMGNADRSFNGNWVQGPGIELIATPPHERTNLYAQKKYFTPRAFPQIM
jgi:hypothetical protein